MDPEDPVLINFNLFTALAACGVDHKNQDDIKLKLNGPDKLPFSL